MADIIQDEIAVQNDKKSLVAQAAERIRTLFKVEATFSSPESSGYQWVQLKGPKEGIEKAKEYVKSLCNPEIKGCKVVFEDRFYKAIYNYGSHVEKMSSAVVMFASRNEALIQGSSMAVAIASSALEERAKELKAGLEHGDIERTIMTSNVLPIINSPERKFEQVQTSPQTHAYIDPSLEEFAMKLGYTKDDIYQVVRKQGKEVDQNTLLHELIKVSTPVRNRGQLDVVQPPLMTGPIPAPLPTRRGDVVARGTPTLPPTSRQFNFDSTSSYLQLPSEGQHAVSGRPPEEEAVIYQQVVGQKETSRDSDLRHIVIDGSNVAMSHGNQQLFSCQGIKICVEWFKKRGHKEITVFVPQWRKEMPRAESPMEDQQILLELERERHVVFTPSRKVNGRRIVCYDDRFIVRLADETDGIIVSNDNFRDLFNENHKWQEVIEQRILMFSFVGDIFMVPDDPLGRHGPTLNDFLRKGTVSHPRRCPYLGRCTYGLRCKFYHPERDPGRKDAAGEKHDAQTRRQLLMTSTQSQYRAAESAPQGGARDMTSRGGVQLYGEQSMPHTAPRGGVPQQYNTNPNGQHMPYNGAHAAMYRQSLMRGGQRESERHTQVPAYRANYEHNDGPINAVLLNELKDIFPHHEEEIERIMRENPNADKQLLAALIASCI